MLDITPGTDTRLRLFSKTPTGFHELGRFDCFHDALRAKEAAEDTAKSLRRIFGLPDQDPING